MLWRTSLVAALLMILSFPADTRAVEVSPHYRRLKEKLRDIDESLTSLSQRRLKLSFTGNEADLRELDDRISGIQQQREEVMARIQVTEPFLSESPASQPAGAQPETPASPTEERTPETPATGSPDTEPQPSQAPTVSTEPPTVVEPTGPGSLAQDPGVGSTPEVGGPTDGNPNSPPSRSVTAPPTEEELDQILSDIAEQNRKLDITEAEIEEWDLEPTSSHAEEGPSLRPITNDAAVSTLNNLSEGRLETEPQTGFEIDHREQFLEKSIAQAESIKSALENGEEVSMEDIVEAIENLRPGVNVNVNVPGAGGAERELASVFQDAMRTIAEIREEANPTPTTILSSRGDGALPIYTTPPGDSAKVDKAEEKQRRPRSVEARNLYQKRKMQLKAGEKEKKYIFGKKKMGRDLGTLTVKGKKDTKAKISSSLIAALTKTLKAKKKLTLGNAVGTPLKKKPGRGLVSKAKHKQTTKALSLREVSPKEANTLSFWSESLATHPQMGWAIGCLLAFLSGALIFHRRT